MKKWFKRIAILVLVVVIGLGIYGTLLVRRSFPQVDGELALPGLIAQATVTRDDFGVPTIAAENSHDLFFAQGYTHAQDRFWQMDFWRHIGAGRLAEMFGESQVDTDKFLRSLGFTALAEQELAAMNEEDRLILEWYADGVNAYLATHSGAEISLEYAVLPLQNSGYEIEPWSPVHTLTWAKLMSWDLSGNMDSEIARTVMSATLPTERVEQLYPEFPLDHPVIVPSDQAPSAKMDPPTLPADAVAALTSAGEAAQGLWDVTGGGFEGIGSNSWVVGGSLTASGLPILANDPHLGIQMPSIWYANALECTTDSPDCPFHVVGFSFPGTPGVVIGHNDHIAWGVTTQATDTQDLFIEKVNPEVRDEYEVDGGWVPFDIRQEVIKVAGGDDVAYEVWTSRHGPIISETFLDEGELDGPTTDEAGDYLVAMAWQTLEPSTLVESILGINRATDYDQFRAAVSLWDIAAQNIVYADTAGNIAYHSTGEIPIRANGDGRYPVPGWTTEYDWTGIVPFDEMPHLLNPPRDYIETANQPVLTPGAAPYLGGGGRYAYRAERIDNLLQSVTSATVTGMQQMQMDNFDGGAAQLVPFLVQAPTDNERVLTMQRLLSEWDFQADGTSVEAAIYQGAWRHVLKNTFQDELPEDQWPKGGERWFETVAQLLASPDDQWWDDAATTEIESRDTILAQSLVDADAELSELLGDTIEEWTWGELHTATFENQTFGQSGIAPVEALFNRSAPARLGGGSSIVNAIGWDADLSYEVDWLPSMRMVIDLSDFTTATFIHTTGQSGHAYHDDYDNMIEPWTDGVQNPMPWPPFDAAADSVLVLVPGNQ